jgi:two-component system sensor histidine kinase PhcS
MEFVKNMSFAILAEAPSTVPIPRTDPVRQRGSGSEVPPPNRFEQEQMELNLRNARMGAWFVMILVPLCSFLDWMAYPESYWQFLVLRLACAASCIPLLLALNGSLGRRYCRAYPIILPLLPALMICFMIYLSGDLGSGYYAGLTLCIVATAFVFHWTFREIGITLGLVVLAYLAATLPNLRGSNDPRALGIFVNNTGFILLNCVVLYFGSRQHHAIRLREFANRCKVEDQREELAARNEELTTTLKRLRETEAQLDQSEKLASIGRLSAGIVHEINNPLNYVKSAVYLLKKKGRALPPEMAESFNSIAEDIGEGIDRVAAIVSDLRTFAHPENRGSRPVDLQETSRKALRLLAKEIGDRGVTLVDEIPPGVIAQGDENYLIQILLNLVQNSLDALAGCPSPTILLKAQTTASGVDLIVRDNGMGIPKENLSKIFDPFFTTKQVGQGMGLGLSICFRLIQQMGGEVKIDTAEGSHTQFTLSLKKPENS